MANQDESQYGGSRGDSSLFGMAWGLTKFNYAWSALEMVHEAPTKGYFLPWTRAIEGKGKIANFGQRLGAWGEKGLTLGSPNAAAAKMYKQSWGMGFNHSKAMKAVAKEFGEGVALRAAGSSIVGTAAGVALRAFWPVTVTAGAIGVGKFLWGEASGLVRQFRGLELGGYFPENQNTYTSRQRSLQAITASQMQAKSAIGNEAMLFHR
jgi:hypothetical protein